MSDTAKRNVVSLDDYGQMRRGLGNGPGTKALSEIRKLAGSRLQHHVGRMMEKIDDALFARAEKAESNTVQTQYFDAMRELRIIRKDIEEDFIQGFESRFNQGVPRQVQSGEAFSLNFEDDASLGLVDKNDMEEDLAISNMVNKIRGTCTQSLYSLDKRIGFLISDPDLERWHNPLGPEALCNAFRDAAKRIETGLEIRLVIFKLFDQHVVCHMDELYKELNQHLVKLGVLPEIRTTVRKSSHPVPRPQATYMPESGDEQSTGYESVDYGQGVPADHGGPFFQTGIPGGGYPGGAQASISALTFLQQGGVAAANDQGAGFTVDPSALASGQVNILHGIKASPLVQDLGKSGDMTIDIVAMLFDYILDDRNIPDAMRALIGRLQIPVLKVALLEREFFTRKSHPARQLLNRLADTAVGWDEQQGNDDPVFRKVEAVVQTILDEFEDDSRLFESLLEDLDGFLQQEQERAEVRAERSAKVMEGQERLEVAKSTTLEEIEPRVSGEDSLDFVREFVTSHWKNLLFITCARQGKDSDAWKQAVATMDDLIWSVKPKHSVEDRKRLVAIQPSLLNNLRAGMERLSIPATERDDFIARLVHAHGRTAVNKEMSDGDIDEHKDEVASEPAATDKETPVKSLRGKHAANKKSKDDKAGKTAPIDDEHSARVRQLTTGTWIEINGSDGKTTRVKLSWISPITSTYLFTDRQGLKAGNYSQEELAQLLRVARARIVNNIPLMDRAVGTVLKEYQKQS